MTEDLNSSFFNLYNQRLLSLIRKEIRNQDAVIIGHPVVSQVDENSVRVFFTVDVKGTKTTVVFLLKGDFCILNFVYINRKVESNELRMILYTLVYAEVKKETVS